jgi:hypothetical protein
MTERLSIAICLARPSTPCNGTTTFTVYFQRNLQRGCTSPAGRLDPVGDRGYSRAGWPIDVLPTSAPAWPPALTATQDGRHGRLSVSRLRRLLPLPLGRHALPSHPPARGMAGAAPCRASACGPGPPPAFWRHRGQHPAGSTQTPRGHGRRPPTTWPACRLTWSAWVVIGVADRRWSHPGGLLPAQTSPESRYGSPLPSRPSRCCCPAAVSRDYCPVSDLVHVLVELDQATRVSHSIWSARRWGPLCRLTEAGPRQALSQPGSTDSVFM